MNKNLSLVLSSTKETCIMVFASGFLAFILGLILAIFLYKTNVSCPLNITLRDKKVKVLLNIVHQILSYFVNILRSFPFIILIIILMPWTRKIVGTAIGLKSAIIPLAIAAAPLIARLVESAFTDVDVGLIQAARVMGSNNFSIIFKVLIPESLANIVESITLTLINLVGYSAMAGTVGAGGLGDLAVRYGYQRFRTEIMLLAVLAIIIIVEFIQLLGNFISKKIRQAR